MVNSVENNLVNNNKLNVGVINPPNALHKPVLYTHKEGVAKTQALMHDLYEKEKMNSFENKRNTPLSVKISLLLAALAAGYITFRKALKW